MIITSRDVLMGVRTVQLILSWSLFSETSPESILQEMIECQNRYGIQIFDIEDDNFTFDQERAKRLMSLIIETFGERTLELTAMNGSPLPHWMGSFEVDEKSRLLCRQSLICEYGLLNPEKDGKTCGQN